jgi:tRNA dimethylallyltransferase
MPVLTPIKKVMLIAGPTAVGKTAVAIELARHFRTSIISADSRQCFKELHIGVARPSAEELAAVPHYFIASHSVQEEINAAGFEQYALAAAKEVFRNHDTVIMAGGTGLYIRAFCEGLDAIPDIPSVVRQQITEQYAAKGLSWLQDEVQAKDPAYFAAGEIQNPQRLMRALEVKEATGQSILDFQKGEKVKRDFECIKVGLELPRPLLYERINKRVDQMMEDGLLEEVKGLLKWEHLNALQTVGYAELFRYLQGEIQLEQAVEEIKKNTRHYAKRQLTWFKRDSSITWFSPLEPEKIKEHLMSALS